MNIFRHKYASIVWTIARVWLGFQWIGSGLGKLGNPKWVGAEAGTALTGFLNGALAKAAGERPAVQGWYADFVNGFALPNVKFMSHLVAFGETLVGISLILGLFTLVGLVAGSFMNLNFLLAGTTSTNPNLYTVAVVLLLVGPMAYFIGLDRWALPFVKDLWKKIFKKKEPNIVAKT